MNIPATAVLLDGTRVHGWLTTEHGCDRPGMEDVPLFVDNEGATYSWCAFTSIDTHAASSRGGRANTPAQNAARAANATQPVREGRRPRGRPRKCRECGGIGVRQIVHGDGSTQWARCSNCGGTGKMPRTHEEDMA